MYVHVSEPLAHKAIIVNEFQKFIMVYRQSPGEGAEM